MLRVPRDEAAQAVLAVRELERLSELAGDRLELGESGGHRPHLAPAGAGQELLRGSQDIPGPRRHPTIPPNVWRLRETQSLVDWLRARSGAAVRVADIAGWMDRQPDGHWWSLLREGLEDLFHELGDRETDRRDVVEWLAEWGRDARKRQTGLLLLSAHRAKGLEFDDVVILDGGWGRPSNGEDGDAERRLYYVAVTRARRSLTLLSMGARHPFIDSLEGPAVAYRALDGRGVDVADCRKIYRTLNPSEVDLDFAGRLTDRTSGAPVARPDCGGRCCRPEEGRRSLADRRPRWHSNRAPGQEIRAAGRGRFHGRQRVCDHHSPSDGLR